MPVAGEPKVVAVLLCPSSGGDQGVRVIADEFLAVGEYFFDRGRVQIPYVGTPARFRLVFLLEDPQEGVDVAAGGGFPRRCSRSMGAF